MPTVESALLSDFGKLRDAYARAGFVGRTFQAGSLAKAYSAMLAKHEATSEALLKQLTRASLLGDDTEGAHLRFMETVATKPQVHVFLLLAGLVRGLRRPESGRKLFQNVFDSLSSGNGVSLWTPHDPEWSRPGIPCLLEALIQLVAAEQTTYTIAGPGARGERRCWVASALFSMKCAELAAEDLTKDEIYAGLDVASVVDAITSRAAAVRDMSDEEALGRAHQQTIPDYNVARGGFHFLAGFASIQVANSSGDVDFFKELRPCAKETGARAILDRYLGS